MADEDICNFCIYDFYAGSDGSLQLFGNGEGSKKQTETIMRKMNRRELSFTVLGAMILFGIIAAVLSKVNGTLDINVSLIHSFLSAVRLPVSDWRPVIKMPILLIWVPGLAEQFYGCSKQ